MACTKAYYSSVAPPTLEGRQSGKFAVLHTHLEGHETISSEGVTMDFHTTGQDHLSRFIQRCPWHGLAHAQQTGAAKWVVVGPPKTRSIQPRTGRHAAMHPIKLLMLSHPAGCSLTSCHPLKAAVVARTEWTTRVAVSQLKHLLYPAYRCCGCSLICPARTSTVPTSTAPLLRYPHAP